MAYDDMCPKHAYLEILPCRFHSPVLFATLCNKPYSTPFEVAFSYFHHFCEIRKEWIRQNNYANLQKKSFEIPKPTYCVHQSQTERIMN